MTLYDVSIFAVVRVKIEKVEAESQTDAITNALNQTDLHEVIARGELYHEYAGEVSHYLVDEVDDTDYLRSQWYLDADHNEDTQWADMLVYEYPEEEVVE